MVMVYSSGAMSKLGQEQNENVSGVE